jgi:uncharacterized protein YcbK (DUF882 family)
MFIHEKRTRKGIKPNNNTALFEKIKTIIENGAEVEYSKIFETDDEIEAYKFEFEKIEEIGIDNLCNLTKDYLRTSVSDMVKIALKKSKKWKESQMRKKSIETREYYRSINTGENNPRYGKTNTEQHMNAIKRSLIGVAKSDEHKKKISESLKGIIRSDEFKKKISDSLRNSSNFKEATQSEEFRNKHKKNAKKRHDDLITYYFEFNGDIIIHKGGLKNMSDKYNISYYYLKKLRYGQIIEYNGWKFISLENMSFKTSKMDR